MSGPETSLIKPSGFWQTLVKIFIKSRVDSRKPFIESRVDSRKCLSKAEWILANDLSKAEWILANLVLSPVDSGEIFYEAEWIPGKLS